MTDHERALKIAKTAELCKTMPGWEDTQIVVRAYLETRAEVERLRERCARLERERDDARSEASIPLLAALDDRDAAIQRAEAAERALRTEREQLVELSSYVADVEPDECPWCGGGDEHVDDCVVHVAGRLHVRTGAALLGPSPGRADCANSEPPEGTETERPPHFGCGYRPCGKPDCPWVDPETASILPEPESGTELIYFAANEAASVLIQNWEDALRDDPGFSSVQMVSDIDSLIASLRDWREEIRKV